MKFPHPWEKLSHVNFDVSNEFNTSPLGKAFGPKVLMFLDGRVSCTAYKTLLYPGVEEISHYALRVNWV